MSIVYFKPLQIMTTVVAINCHWKDIIISHENFSGLMVKIIGHF